MCGTQGARAEYVPFRIVPERGKVTEGAVEPKGEVSGDVLDDDIAWLYLSNDAGELGPQVTVILRPPATT